jgi:hypothetical protein
MSGADEYEVSFGNGSTMRVKEMPTNVRITADYLYPLFHPDRLPWIIANAAKALKKDADQFEAIAFSGYSGALVAPQICAKLGKYPILVRKPKTEVGHHSYSRVEGLDGTGIRYIIVDDFVCSGATVRTIIEQMRANRPMSVCQGIFEWKTFGGSARVNVSPFTASEGPISSLPRIGTSYTYKNRPWYNDEDPD